MRWRSIEISPKPILLSDLASSLLAAPKRRRRTLPKRCASVRASTLAYRWMAIAGIAKNLLGSWEQAVAWFRRSIEANRNIYAIAYFHLAAALANIGRLVEAHSAVGRSALNLAFPVSRAHAAWTAMSDDPTFLAQLEPILDGMRKAGVPEG